jgi:hypothetical protein
MKKTFRMMLMTIGALLITAGNSWANTVVYDKVGIFKTETFFIEEFEISEAGSYMASLTNFDFPASMIDTGMSVVTATQLLGSIMLDSTTPAAGSFTFDATPGIYSVAFYGTADPSTASQLGLYGMEISQIPIPAAVWLFGSGLLGLALVSRANKAV